MSEARINTALRFKVSSLLALTTSAAVTMAIAGPFLTGLSRSQHWLILGLLMLLGLSVVFSTVRTIRRRKKISHECGALLVTLPLDSLQTFRIVRWGWLLLTPPLIISPLLLFYFLTRTENFYLTPVAILLLYQVGSAGKWGVMLWTEGYSNIELCEKGIVQLDQFYAWSSPKIQDLFITQLDNDLVIKLKGFFSSIHVPEEQQALVRSILKTHYQRPKPPDQFA